MSRASTPPGAQLSKDVDDLRSRYDVVVVGSGYGGGVAASRLARTGRRVCVLERGRELRPGQFPDSLWGARDDMQVNAPLGRVGDRRSLFEFHVNDDINALVGCGLGGTSLINASVVEAADPRVFSDPVWPKALRPNGDRRPLADYEERAREMLRPVCYPDDHPALGKLDALEAAGEAMDAPTSFRRPSIAVSFEPHVGPGGVRQQPCTGCGDCVTGCNHGAKNTTLMNYLPDAVSHGAEVFCETEVVRVERDGDGTGWLVLVRLLGDGRHRFGDDELFVRADVVVLGAGALGSTGIMLRSRDAGLDLSPALGTRFSGNADVLAFGYDADRPVAGFGRRNGPPPMVGPCITGMLDARATDDPDDGLLVEEGSVPAAIGRGTALLLAARAGLDGRPLRSLPGHLARRLVSVARSPGHGATGRSQVYLVMGHDDSDGRLELDGEGDVRIVWPGVGRKPVFRRIDQRLRAGSAAIGATHVHNPLWDDLFGHDLITVHPLGGCPMSDDPAQGVVDDVGRVYRGDGSYHDGLYVVDGAVIPRSVGINPLLTITAIAERAVERVACDRGWAIDDGPGRDLVAGVDGAGVRFTERMAGTFRPVDGGPSSTMSFLLTAITPPVDAFLDDPEFETEMIGTCTCAALSADPMTVIDARFNLLCPDDERPDTVLMRYRFALRTSEGPTYRFDGTKVLGVRSFVHLWPDTTTLDVEVSGDDGLLGTAELRIGPVDFLRQLSTMRSVGGASAERRRDALGRFVAHFAGGLIDQYGGVFGRPGRPTGAVRRPRPLRCGPPDEVIEVPTDDGVPIRLTRHRGGDKGPVLLVHGAAVSSAIFSTDLVGTNLVEHLFDEGYDVWLLDTRFSIALPSAVGPADGDQSAALDHPTAVRTVLERTGAADLQAVVHCYGSNTFFMSLLSGLAGVRSVVASQVAVHLDTPPMTTVKTHVRVPRLLRAVGFGFLDAAASPRPSRSARLTDRALRGHPMPDDQACRSASCRRSTFFFGLLWSHENLTPHLHDHLHELVGPCGVTNFAHIAAMVRRGTVVDRRGRATYDPNVDRLRDIPIRLIHGERNQCYLPSSTERTESWLRAGGHTDVDRVLIPGYGHLDCIFGEQAHRDVFPHIVEHLART